MTKPQKRSWILLGTILLAVVFWGISRLSRIRLTDSNLFINGITLSTPAEEIIENGEVLGDGLYRMKNMEITVKEKRIDRIFYKADDVGKLDEIFVEGIQIHTIQDVERIFGRHSFHVEELKSDSPYHIYTYSNNNELVQVQFDTLTDGRIIRIYLFRFTQDALK